jgi:hypothetical protein
MFSALNSKNYKQLSLTATIFNQDGLGLSLKIGHSIPSQGYNMFRPTRTLLHTYNHHRHHHHHDDLIIMMMIIIIITIITMASPSLSSS